MLSLYQQHLETWKGCTRCPLSEHRTRMVFARGRIPCDVLFMGEAPGRSEDVLGKPFVGPAGQLLDAIIARSVPKDVTHAFTNLVCCIPLEEDGEKAAAPDGKEIKACAPRLTEFIELARPKLIVCVGKLAKDYLDPSERDNVWKVGGRPELAEIKRIDVIHPAAILRANFANRGLLIQRAGVTITTAIEEMEDRDGRATSGRIGPGH